MDFIAFKLLSLLVLGIVAALVVVYVVWGVRKKGDKTSNDKHPYSSIDLWGTAE